MKAKILGLFFSILSFVGYGQTIDGKLYTNFNNYYKWRGGAFDTTLLIPQTASSNGKRPGALYYNSADSSVYSWSGSQWRKVTGADTTSLSNRINLRVTYTDTAAMLTPYLRKVDTAFLSNRINLKVNISDTANMLNPYLRKIDTATLSNRINLKVNISDTSTMLSPYLRSNVAAATYQPIGSYLVGADTVSLSNRINLKVNISDTATMLTPYLRTNVATATYQPIGNYRRDIDTVPLAVFNVGSAAAGDTTAFTTSTLAGSFYLDGTDTMFITSYRVALQGTSASVTPDVWFNDSLNVTAGGTKLVTSPSAITNLTTGTSVTPNTNKIPPGNFVFVRFSAVTTKPTYFTLTLFGYRIRKQ